MIESPLVRYLSFVPTSLPVQCAKLFMLLPKHIPAPI
jgi:hypothetical protein